MDVGSSIHSNHGRGTAALPYAEILRSARQFVFKTKTPTCAGGHGGPPLHGTFVICRPIEKQSDIDTKPAHRAEGGVHRRPESTYAQKQHPVVNVKFSWASWWRPEMDAARSNM